MSIRNRSEGWRHAKISGHSNETDITKKINNSKKFRENFEKKLKLNSKIKSAVVGGLKEKNVEDVFGKSTKSKTDLTITLENNGKSNISIKKSLVGQVYLIGVERFLRGFEIQFKKKISQDVERSFKLFFGGTEDIISIIDNARLKNIKDETKKKIKNYEKIKNRVTWSTLREYDLELSNTLIKWFKQNIEDIFLFCFQRGLSKKQTDWANFVWYKNELDENKIDLILDIKKLSVKINNDSFKSMIIPGKTLGGTTIQLPFGFVQWHQGQIQFHHNLNLMTQIV